MDWRLPSSGQFTFDFVALYRPPADAQPAAPEAWGQVLAALAEPRNSLEVADRCCEDLLAPKIRAGDQEPKGMWAEDGQFLDPGPLRRCYS